MFASPTMMAPAASRFATMVASLGAMSSYPGRENPSQPAVVTFPRTLVFALTTMGTPQSGPWVPSLAASLRAAAVSACSRRMVSMAP